MDRSVKYIVHGPQLDGLVQNLLRVNSAQRYHTKEYDHGGVKKIPWPMSKKPNDEYQERRLIGGKKTPNRT